MGKFDGQVALITGGAAGIGAATAKKLASEGATIVIADRDIEGAEKLVAELPGRNLGVEFDAREAASIESMVKRTIDEFGQIDILHNNVGVTTAAWTEDKLVVDTPVEVWDMIFDVNVRSHFLASKYALPHMIERGKGVIINMASVAGLRGGAGLVSYGVSKAAVIHLTKFMAVQYGRSGIRINSIAPGVIRTQQLLDNATGLSDATLDTLPFPRTGEPEDVANLVAFLASDQASFINGDVVTCDGGGMAGQATRLGLATAGVVID